MKISNNYIRKTYINSNCKTNSVVRNKKENLTTDTVSFEGYYNPKGVLKDSIIFPSDARTFKRFVEKKGIVTLEQYKKIEQDYPAFIEIANLYVSKNQGLIQLNSSPKTIAKAALNIMYDLDQSYGKDNYQIIAIGSSPAGIGEVIKSCGRNVEFLPIGNLSRYYPDNFFEQNLNIRGFFTKKQYPNIKKAMKYLKKIKSKNKTNIFVDFIASGRTMENMHYLTSVFGIIKKEDFTFYSIYSRLKLLKDNDMLKHPMSYEELLNFKTDLQKSKVDFISNTPHFNVIDNVDDFESGYISSKDKSDKKLFQELENYSYPFARMFNLCAIDEAQKLLNKINIS